MFQRILFCGILAAVLIAIAAWAIGLIPVAAKDGAETEPGVRSGNPAPRRTADGKVAIGGPLYAPPAPFAQRPPLPRPTPQRSSATDPIVVINCHLGFTNKGKADVPSPRNVEGLLVFIGVELKPGENAPPHQTFDVQVGNETKRYRRLNEGDQVSAGQALALVDDRLPRADVISKEAKWLASKADYDAAEKTREETYQRYRTNQRLYQDGQKISYEEFRGSEATWHRYEAESVSKKYAINVADAEWKQARTILSMYQLRASIAGKVKTLYKHEGESIKALDPVLQIQNYDRLRAEGMVDLQYVQGLHEGMNVVIEPIVRDAPERSFMGHRGEITGVAVSKDAKNPMIVSCSEDGTARVWKRSQRQQYLVLRHPEKVAVRAVACTPPGSEANLCLTGASDGIGRLWDLDNDSEQPLRELKGKHRSGGIRCVAFSPDGKICATGGDDRDILIWDTASGELRYRLSGQHEIPPHKDTVTALHFTPDSHLVSVGHDDAVRVWKLGEKGAEPERTIKRRAHEIAQLGISPDGQWVLDEHGQELRILSLSKDLTEGSLQSKTTNFKTLALFSPPDGQLILTTSGSEGHLQLWRRDPVRSYELRQLTPGLRFGVTCAAFDPNGQFVVAGTQGHKVYLWPMPTEKEITRQITATITDIERIVESGVGTVRIVAEFDNPPDRPLHAQDTVTLVAYPSK